MKNICKWFLGLVIEIVCLIAAVAIFTGIVVWAIGNDETSGEVITGENYVIREATLEISDLSSGMFLNYDRELPYWKIIVNDYDVNYPDEFYIAQLSNNDETKKETAEFFSKVMESEVRVLDYNWWEENQEYKIEGVFLVGSTPYIFEMSE